MCRNRRVGWLNAVDQSMPKRLWGRSRLNLGGAELPSPRANPILPLANGAKNTFPLVELWSSDLARRTLMIWTVWFFALLGYYGLTTWLGALLQASGYTVTKSVTYTLMISLAGLPGFATAAWLVEAWGRKPTCVLMLLGSAVCAYFMAMRDH